MTIVWGENTIIQNFVHICTNFDFAFYEIYSHLGLENTSNTWCPMLYLTYSGIGENGKALFYDKKNFKKCLPSLKNNGGLVPDRPGREERAKSQMHVV